MKTSNKLGLAIVIFCIVLFAVFGVINAGNTPWPQHAAAFACFGLMIGAIMAFDSESGDRQKKRPFLRTLLSSVAGLGFGWVLDFPVDGIILSCLVAAILGYAGLTWAKYF